MSNPSPTPNVQSAWYVSPWGKFGLMFFVCSMFAAQQQWNAHVTRDLIRQSHEDMMWALKTAREDADKSRAHGSEAVKEITLAIRELSASISTSKNERTKQMQDILTTLVKIETWVAAASRTATEAVRKAFDEK